MINHTILLKRETMKITYYAAMSLDGYIAKEDGDVSWLDTLNIEPNESGYEEFLATVDGLVMGRNTYDFIHNYGTWPYEGKPAWVCTSRELEILEGADLSIVLTAEDVVKEAELKGVTHLWLVGGGKLASSFIESRLLTHLSISEMPIKLGKGIPFLADHRLENLPVESVETFLKKGFKQIEIALEV
jgi:dihydrofolate reductase